MNAHLCNCFSAKLKGEGEIFFTENFFSFYDVNVFFFFKKEHKK